MELIIFLLLALTMVPLFAAWKRAKHNRKYKGFVFANIALFFMVAIGAIPIMAASDAAGTVAAAGSDGLVKGLGYLGAALSTGMSCIGAGIAVAGAASSAIGATSENPKMFAKSMLFVALAEGVALYGMLISFQIISAL